MVNPFTVQSQIYTLQKEVLRPLYTNYPGQESAEHEWLLVKTGRVIAEHQSFIEELCRSRFIAVVFKIIKLLGGAEQLTSEDFNRFTSYVRDGGIGAMVRMLLAADKEKTFLSELRTLSKQIRSNAPMMLSKSSKLHKDFINGYFVQQYGTPHEIPTKLLENFEKSTAFIERLAVMAGDDLKTV